MKGCPSSLRSELDLRCTIKNPVFLFLLNTHSARTCHLPNMTNSLHRGSSQFSLEHCAPSVETFLAIWASGCRTGQMPGWATSTTIRETAGQDSSRLAPGEQWQQLVARLFTHGTHLSYMPSLHGVCVRWHREVYFCGLGVTERSIEAGTFQTLWERQTPRGVSIW